MKAPSVRDFSVFSHLGNLLAHCSEQVLSYTIFGGKFRENKRVSLKKPVYNVLLHCNSSSLAKVSPWKSALRLRFFTICGLKTLYNTVIVRNSVQNVIFTANTCILCAKPCSANVFLRWIQYYKHCLPQWKLASVRDFSVFSHLGNLLAHCSATNFHIRSFGWNFEKIREFHWKNLFITYFCTDSSSLAKVSPWK